MKLADVDRAKDLFDQRRHVQRVREAITTSVMSLQDEHGTVELPISDEIALGIVNAEAARIDGELRALGVEVPA